MKFEVSNAIAQVLLTVCKEISLLQAKAERAEKGGDAGVIDSEKRIKNVIF